MKAEILSLRKSGKTYDEIAEMMGCSKSTVAYHCSDEIKKASQVARLKNRRANISDLKKKHGGKCSLCDYNRCLTSLHFHHRDPSVKEDTVSRILCCKGIKAAEKEAKKCDLICSNCHGELEEQKRGTYDFTEG